MFARIAGFENYSVDESGCVINNKTGRELRQTVHTSRGVSYKVVFLYNADGRKAYFVHRLVALAFLPNPEQLPQVNHKDENSMNNHISNLEWCDGKYNMNYGTRIARQSTRMKGAGNPFFGKKHSDVSRIKMSKAHIGKPSNQRKKVIVDGADVFDSLTECAAHLGISLTQVFNIIHHKRKSEHTINYFEEAA